MKTLQGSCHCGAVRFEAALELRLASECNCSICTKKGAIHHRVQAFRLLTGAQEIKLYQFGERIAKHWFCPHCGIHTHTNPRAAPDKVSINLRCLDDFHSLRSEFGVQAFDGQHWEEAMRGARFE